MSTIDESKPLEVVMQRVMPLHREAYYDYLCSNIAEATKRIYAAVFIIDPRVSEDMNLKVRTVFSALADRTAKGVDVKVIIGTSKAEDIYVANEVAKKYAAHLGLRFRQYKGDKDSLHSKFAVIDENISVVGSPNWSDGGFGRHVEDSIGIESKSVNKFLATRFMKIWNTSVRPTK